MPQRPNGASVKWLFTASNERFLGVINLYAKVTLGTRMAAQIVLAWVGGGVLELEQAAVRLSPPTSTPETSILLFLLLYDCSRSHWECPVLARALVQLLEGRRPL